jgi:hypothetical protein
MDGDGELRLTIMATLAQEESRKVSERVKAGQKISRDNGVVYGTDNIMGYDRDGTSLKINSEQAETVCMIYDMYLNTGMGSKKIANELTRLHRRAASGEIKWTCSNVGHILANPTYMSYITYGKSFSNNYLEQKRILNHDTDLQMVVKGDFEPIVSEEDWLKVEKLRHSRLAPALIPSVELQRKTHTQRSTIDLWATKLFCACGGHFRKNRWHKNKFKEWSYGYECYNKLNNGTAKQRREAGMDDTGYCDMTMIADWKLDAMSKMLFEQLWGERREAIQLACKMIRENYSADKPVAIDRSAIHAQIARIEGRIANLVDMRTEGDISKEEYRSRRSKLENELESAKAEAAENAIIPSVPQEFKLRWKEIERTLNQAVDFSGEKVSEAVIDKFIRRVTPLGNNRYAFHLNLDNNITERLTAGVEGRKGNFVVFTDDKGGDGEPSPPVHNIIEFRLLQGLQSGKNPSAKNRIKSAFPSGLFLCLQTTYSRLGGGQTRDRHTEGRTTHIVEAIAVAEFDAAGVAAVLTTDAHF